MGDSEPVLDDEPFRLLVPKGRPRGSAADPVAAGLGLPGKDELNLAEFPIALVTDKVPPGQKTLRFEDRVFDERKGQMIHRKLVVTASDEYGLPTAKDDEVIIGLIQLTRLANGFDDRTVHFSRSELIRLLRWPDTGPSYRRLALALHRWLGVSLHYDNAWWDKARQRWSTLGFHILESFKVADSSPGPGEPPLSRFTWSEDIFRSFRAGYLKQIDLDFYLGLTHPTAKRMYRFLDKRFFHRPSWDFDLKEFAFDHIGLSRSYEGNTQIARKLAPAIAELEARGFLEPLPPDRRYRRLTGSRWRITLARTGAPEPAPAEVAAPAEAPALSPGGARSGDRRQAEPSELAALLIARGVTPATAESLAIEFPEAEVRARLAAFDWLVARRDRRVSKSPAGYLVRSIRDGYTDPHGFPPPAAVPAAVATVPTAAPRRRAPAQAAPTDVDRSRIDAYLAALGPEDRARLQAAALESAGSFLLRQYRRHHPAAPAKAAHYLGLMVDARVLAELDDAGPKGPPARPAEG